MLFQILQTSEHNRDCPNVLSIKCNALMVNECFGTPYLWTNAPTRWSNSRVHNTSVHTNMRTSHCEVKDLVRVINKRAYIDELVPDY